LKEQFSFLKGRQIHESIGVAQEGLHSLKTKNAKGTILKIDLSKAFDRINWSYIRLLLTHLGFEVPFLNGLWISSHRFPSQYSLMEHLPLSSFQKKDSTKDAPSPHFFSYWWLRD
jgi:hypothetical protein